MAEDIREGGEITMCELLDKYWNGGVEEGVQRRIQQGKADAVDTLIS